jgi:cytochrome b561
METPTQLHEERYSAVAIGLHWTTAALVLSTLICAWWVELTPDGTFRRQVLTIHRSFGVSVLGVVLFRLVWRATHPAPPPPGSLAPWQQSLAVGTHRLLYALLIVMPIVGYVATNAGNHAVSLFGLLELPRLVAPDPGLASIAKATHESLQWFIYAIVALHAAAALRHHLVIRDNVLRRMLPSLAARPAADAAPESATQS